MVGAYRDDDMPVSGIDDQDPLRGTHALEMNSLDIVGNNLIQIAIRLIASDYYRHTWFQVNEGIPLPGVSLCGSSRQQQKAKQGNGVRRTGGRD